MKKALLKRSIIAFVVLVVISFTALANAPGGGCTTQTIFWGESCCTYTTTGETGGTEIYTKCCKYRFWIIWEDCTTTYAGPI
ncbi:MAG: hypothetical protein U0V75_02380 [Ferruginibacter sp.]